MSVNEQCLRIDKSVITGYSPKPLSFPEVEVYARGLVVYSIKKPANALVRPHESLNGLLRSLV